VAPIRGRRTIFVDTPGFDDTVRPDTEVLREIVAWLNTAHAQNVKLTGIVYLHDINMPRLSGTARGSMRLFQELCGDESMGSVALATSRWSPPAAARERAEQEPRHDQLLRDDRFPWHRMVQWGACDFRHDAGADSARAIVHYLLDRDQNRGRGGVDLRVQREMAGGADLIDTAVGRALEARMDEMHLAYQRELGMLRRDLDEERRVRALDQRRIDQILADQRWFQQCIQDGRDERERLRADIHALERERQRRHERRREAGRGADTMAQNQRNPRNRQRQGCEFM
jgi:hypothetical protein